MEEEEEGLGVDMPSLEVKHLSDEKLQQVEELLLTQQFEFVSDMDDSQLVGVSRVVADEAAVVGEETELKQVEELPSTQHCESVSDMNDLQLAGVSPVVDGEAAVVGGEATPMIEVVMETEAEVAETGRGSGKRKRGRQSRVPTKAPSKKKEEEDVCFICFDGGSLVLCDRRGCPKAYHPACVNRDEAFFRSRGRWNCGWHICSNCEKAAQYMCYTCTYSLCKGCIKEVEFLCVRGNKGFCVACMRTVMLIENNEEGSKEMVQVDFDDKSSWEYLFKDYWIDLKGKLSLTLDELAQARNPWKGSGALAQKEGSSNEICDANDDKGSCSDSSGHLEGSNFKRRKAKKRSKSTMGVDSPSAAEAVGGGGTSMPDNSEWASNELLEFVAHMKNGDKSVLSHFDVQVLLLEYIKRNNLRDPRRKSQIICDSRLENLFGKACVGHFEMLKLLEMHFLMKEDSLADNTQGGVVDIGGKQPENDDNNDPQTKPGKDKRRKTRKKGDAKESQTNLDDYAAINVHNINLIYLQRNLMEELIEDASALHDKVVGSFVRIRISGSSQKQDMYRLVQVVGTSKALEPYKTGQRTTDIMLEILNLNKAETISIDIISNQEFSEEECKRLRQSIKCGLISRMTVGEVREKAMALRAVRVNDWLETEKLRLGHLCDRASEKGRRKELRECVEKLQLLNTSEERLRRLQEILVVHADPNMDPNYESDEDNGEPDVNRKDNYIRGRDAELSRKEREPISPRKGGSALNESKRGVGKNSSTNWESKSNIPTKGPLDKAKGSSGAVERKTGIAWNLVKDAHQPNTWDKPKIQVAATCLETSAWSSQVAVRSGLSSGIAPETAPVSLSTGVVQSSNISETDKIWHYQDPSGKIQGPFSIMQLRRWSTTGYFPADLSVWKTTEKQDDSILLMDLLNGKFHKEPPQWDNSFSQLQKGIALSDNGNSNSEGGRRGNDGSTSTDKKQSDGTWNTNWKDSNVHANSNSVYAKSDGLASRSPGWAAQVTEAVNIKVGQGGNSSRGSGSSKGSNALSGQPQMHSPRPSPSFSEKAYGTPSLQGRERQGGERQNSVQNHATWNSNRSTGFQSSSTHGHEKRSGIWGSADQSSGGNWRSQPENSSSRGWAAPSLVETPKFAREGWNSDKGSKNDSLNLLSPPKPSSTGRTGGQVSENKQSATPAVPVHPTNSGWGTTPIPGGNVLQSSPVAVSEPSQTVSGWSDQQHLSVLPSVGGWDPNSGSVSMPKASETADQDGKIDFSNPPTRTPKPSGGNSTGGQCAENKWDVAATDPVRQRSPRWATAPNQLSDGAQQLSSVKELIKVTAEWGGQSPTPAKLSVGEWDFGAVASSALMSTGTTCCQEDTPIPESGILTHASVSVLPSVKPTEGVDGCSASHTSIPEITVSGANGSSFVANESGSGFPTKHDYITSLSGLATATSVRKGGGYLIQGPQNAFSSTLHGSSPASDLGKGIIIGSTEDQQISSQSVMAGESCRVGQADVLYTQEKSGAHSAQGAEVDGDTGPIDASATVGTEKGLILNTQPDPPATHSAGSLVYTSADSEPNISPPCKTADSSVPNLVSFASSLKLPDETHGLGSGSALKPDIVGSSPGARFESQGWGAASALKQEPPTSNPMAVLAAQKPEQPTYGHWSDDPSSARNSAASYITANLAGNHPTPGLSVHNSLTSGNWAGPPGIQSSDWFITSTAPPTKPSSWGVNPSAANGSTQNNYFAPSDSRNPLVSGNQWETGSTIQPSAPSNTGRNTGAIENPTSAWRPPLENSNTGWVQTQGNANMGWGGPAQGNTNTGWVTGQGSTVQGNVNMAWGNVGAPAGNPGIWTSQQNYNGERFSGQGDLGFQGGDSGCGGGRWNRQWSFGGGSSRSPTKGQRVCKFNETGHCKKGAECDYLHS